ncbi:MAG: hypothetical protein J6A97_05870 [Clostridia bacterium]|nr:hypothetical protein [Clostridia bacterium]
MNKLTEKITERLKKDKKLLLIVLLGFSGMLLLLFSGNGKTEAETRESCPDIAAVEEGIEEKLSSLIKTVDGAGRVKVTVTVDCLQEKTVAVNSETENGENKSEYKSEYVIIESSGGSGGLLLKITAPVIRGVGITCEGAESVSVKQEIIRLVSATLGVPVNRIWVTKMAKK